MPDGREPTKALYTRLYRTLRLIRRSQEALIEAYHPADEMRCPMHFCLGQEAAPAALSAIIRPNDTLMSHYRSHGYFLAKGGSLAAMIAEFYGKRTGANSGLAGSMELSYGPTRFYSGAILGGMFGMAGGAAFSQKYNGTDDITVAVIGDGAMEEGIVFETLNLATLKKLPILFLCENNLYAAYSRIEDRSTSHTLVPRVAPFGLATDTFDGNDPILLYRSLDAAIERIRRGGGPAFVEIMTYRICGHVGPEDDDVIGYRTPEELAKWRTRDPLPVMRAALIQAGASTAELEDIDSSIEREIIAAFDAAKKAEFLVFEDVRKFNSSGSYDPVVSRFGATGVSTFDGAQAETKLAPY